MQIARSKKLLIQGNAYFGLIHQIRGSTNK